MELLVVILMIGVLLGIILPVLGHTLETGRSVKCRMAMRSTAMDFIAFGDAFLTPDRGDDKSLGRDRFHLETFQESQYGIDEFWAWGDEQTRTIPDAHGNNPMRCPTVSGELVLRKNMACTKTGAITPQEYISFGFNARLHRPEVVDDNGHVKANKVALTLDMLDRADTPLMWDVDGAVASVKGVNPVFSAPSLGSQIYANDTHWFPGKRHNGAMNVAFVDGHVHSTSRPLDEGWAWSFQPVD